jgi:predicted RecB family endonuclease
MTRANQLTLSIVSLLRMRGFMAWRNNTGVAKYGKRIVRYGEVGSPDILALDKDGRFYGIEVKTGRDKLSPEQIVWHALLRGHNGVSIIAGTVDEVLAVIGDK